MKWNGLFFNYSTYLLLVKLRLFRILTIVFILSVLVLLLILYNQSIPHYIYGNSYRQNALVNVIRLHKYGITGKNVRIGLIDAGVYTPHIVFEKTKIIKQYDFVNNDSNVISKDHKKGRDHGTNVFSVIGGYKEGELIGIAYDADFILARTDISTDRLTLEEKNAIKAARWIVENGVDIISTSLSFQKFDNTDYYRPSQMNGNTALITKVADRLVQKGVLFFCSAGNGYESDWRIIEPPGDGKYVLAVGSIDKYKKHSFFSSCGPTVDGRIKPDLVTPGEGIWVANHLPSLKSKFGWTHGTSLSAPIAAGIGALILSAHPGLSAEQVTEALKQSCSLSNKPDNLMGWGVPDAEVAVSYFGPAFSNSPEIIETEEGIEIKSYVFSSFEVDNASIKMKIIGNNNAENYFLKMVQVDEDYYSCLIKSKMKKEIRVEFIASDKRGVITIYPYLIKLVNKN